jgi:hypothetical protein
VAVVCSWIESDRPVGGAWLHVLRDSGPTWSPWRINLPRLARVEARR